MGVGLSYLTFSHTWGQMVHMHTRPLLAIVPTVAHLPMIRLHSGHIDAVAKISVTLIELYSSI